MQKKTAIFSILILIATVFMSIGYATVNSIALEISGTATATPQNGIFITEVTQTSSTGTASGEINNFYQTMLDSTVELSSGGSITYEIKVYNRYNKTYAFKTTTYADGFYDNENITYNCSINQNETIASGAYKTFTITFSNNSNSSNELNSYINFVFAENYTITYNDITISDGIQTNIAEGLTYTNTFANPPADIEVTMSGTELTKGTDFTYTNGTLTIPNVTGNLVIAGVTSGSGTWDDPYVDTTTTVYDPDNVHEGTTVYANVDGAPKVTADENGNITRFEYTDTGDNGITVPDGGVNTGVLAFDGNDFTITLVAKFNMNDISGTANPVLAFRDYSDGGCMVNVHNTPVTWRNENNTSNTTSEETLSFGFTKYTGGSSTSGSYYFRWKEASSSNYWVYGTGETEKQLKIVVQNNSNVISAFIYNENNTLVAQPGSKSTLPMTCDFSSMSLDDITIYLGYFNQNGTDRNTKFDVLEFSVVKN